MRPGNCSQCQVNDASKSITKEFNLFDHNGIGHQLCTDCGITFDSNVNEIMGIELSAQDIRNINSRELHRKHFVETNAINDDDDQIYADFGWEDNEGLKSGVAEHVIECIKRHVPGALNELSIIDLGCGNGFTSVEIARNLKCKVVAIDPSPEIEKIDGQLGIVAIRGTLDALKFEASTYDVIVIIGNLMLHSNPVETLREASRILKPGGIVVLDFKNSNSSIRLLTKLATRMGMRFLLPEGMVQRAFVNMRFGFNRKFMKQVAKELNFQIAEDYSKPPRLLEFKNSDNLQAGVKGMLWRLLDFVDRLTNNRAWIQMTWRKDAE